ncbi:gamma-glutamyl-gamma-aminobutyrate hydrolase family protein, partial [Subtercola sp. RTI3]|uniref:gamma-glutamyl-gamma-aminobutyrate hydrolase family protein n=1 Tax=Subtercola sp. RTI3 TaxID=3048639 RepID=UPI002B22629E
MCNDGSRNNDSDNDGIRIHDNHGGGSGARPLIGLTTYLERAQSGVWDVEAAFLPKVYFDAVNRAGGIAVLLPPQSASPEIARRVLDRLDGLIITGGTDIAPESYGQEAHSATDQPRPDRDAWEQSLLTAALERSLPFLGICRGAQLLNVTLGGTLHQHLPDLVGSRRYQAGGGTFSRVGVEIDPTSRLAGLLAHPAAAHHLTLDVPVYHHQAIDRLGRGLRVTAATDDGIVEAIELDGA